MAMSVWLSVVERHSGLIRVLVGIGRGFLPVMCILRYLRSRRSHEQRGTRKCFSS